MLAKYAKSRRQCVQSDQLFSQYKSLYEKLYRYIHQVTVLSFNGSRYDIALINAALMNYFIDNRTLVSTEREREFDRESEIENMFSSGADETSEPDQYSDKVDTLDEILTKMKLDQAGKVATTKRNNSYVSIQNNHFAFLDICQYLPVGTTLRKIFKAYATSGSKLYFPYEYITDFDKLKEPLPPYPSQAWISNLQGGVDILSHEFDVYIENGGSEDDEGRPNTGQENYNMIMSMCRQEWIFTLKQWLKLYNNSDVGPFVEAVENMQREYYNQGLDLFRIAVSIPGVARVKMMRHAQDQNVLFPLIYQLDEDLFWLFKAQLCGGASIIFNR